MHQLPAAVVLRILALSLLVKHDIEVGRARKRCVDDQSLKFSGIFGVFVSYVSTIVDVLGDARFRWVVVAVELVAARFFAAIVASALQEGLSRSRFQLMPGEECAPPRHFSHATCSPWSLSRSSNGFA